MKNISRRVFIKGMAVAAAATAASTVLAGCNLPVNPDEGTPAVGFSPITKTLTDKNGTIDITVTGYAFNADESVTVDLTIVNKVKNTKQTLYPTTVSFYNTALARISANHLCIAGVLDGNYSKQLAQPTLAAGKEDEISADTDSSKNILKTSVTFSGVADGKTLNMIVVDKLLNDKGEAELKEVVFDLAL